MNFDMGTNVKVNETHSMKPLKEKELRRPNLVGQGKFQQQAISRAAKILDAQLI